MGFMAEQESNAAYYGGGGGYGGMMGGAIAMIILVVVVLWLLFRDGHHDGHGGDYGGYGYGRKECGYCVEDETNCEVDRHLTKEICMTDKDVWKTACETQKVEVCEAEKTRALIVHNQERTDDKAYNALQMQLQQKDNYIQTLQLEKNFDGKLAFLGSVVEKGFCKTDREIDKFSCETAKRPPFWSQGFIDDGFAIPPRRGRFNRCDDGCGDGCGCGC